MSIFKRPLKNVGASYKIVDNNFYEFLQVLRTLWKTLRGYKFPREASYSWVWTYLSVKLHQFRLESEVQKVVCPGGGLPYETDWDARRLA